VADAVGQIALIEVVGPHPQVHQLQKQLLEDIRAVVEAAQQNGLVAQGNACVHNGLAGS
jgi:hypothetical protein